MIQQNKIKQLNGIIKKYNKLQVNLSPALSNDCEVDSEVKKPLLHDLFDLLGLPVCNTGLSLFTIWSSPDRIEDEGEVSSKFGRSVKKRSKLGREAETFLNLSSDTRATVIASEPSAFCLLQSILQHAERNISNYDKKIEEINLKILNII